MKHWGKALVAALVVPLALAACLFMPGKFESTLDIRADRSFTFTYKGEVAAVDIGGMMGQAMAEGFKEAAEADGNSTGEEPAAGNDTDPFKFAQSPEDKAKKEAEYRELALTVAKEAGYRSVEYRGNGIFYVDYAITGRLTHNFTFPFNQDAQMVFPFVAVELRGKDSVRIKAPGFAKQDSSAMGGMGGGAGDIETKTEGTFTLTTDAELVSQNNEDGATTSGKDRKVLWKVTPTTQDAPMAVLRVAGL